MSKKKWRNPANPGYNKPAVDPSIPDPQPLPKADPQAVNQPAVSRSNPDPSAEVRASGLSDRDALIMLGESAKLLFTMLGKALDALNLVDHRLLAKVVKDEAEPTPEYGKPQQRPRGRHHPLLVLFQYGLRAGSLLPRILRMTHAHLFGKAGSDAQKTIEATEQIVAKLKDALQGKPPQAAPAAA
jgi:hypothetical protein